MSTTARMLAIAALALIAAAIVSASAGAGDRPSCFGHRATIVGINGDDHLQGTDANDVIVGKGGKDTIDHLHHGTDYVCGNGGNDNIKAKESDVAHVSGGRGFDVCEVERDHGDQARPCEQIK